MVQANVRRGSLKALANSGYQPAHWRIRRPIYYEGVQWAVTASGLEMYAGQSGMTSAGRSFSTVQIGTAN